MNIAYDSIKDSHEYRPVDGEPRVRFMAGACLAVRNSTDACRACESTCPATAITRYGNGISVRDTCIGCGQCASACPTGAIAVKGFQDISPLPGGNTVRVECLKVPVSLSGHGALRVPCLGGISPSQWLEIVEAAALRRVVVVDRGWCKNCSASKCNSMEHPASDALNLADIVLGDAGWPEVRRPRFEKDPLPASLMPADIPAERPESLARRALFRRIGDETRRAIGEPKLPLSPRLLKQHGMPIPERDRLLSISARIARDAGVPMPAAPFLAMSIASSCGHHAVCAGLCPTGALATYEDDGVAGLEFNPWRCIGCSQCQKACPEKSISFFAAPASPDPERPNRLTRHVAGRCRKCLKPFHSAHGEQFCTSCQQNHRMASGLFGTLFAVKKS